uniref:Uncharacterized protein n=1 Tax=Chrysotila carterae TaxID=13221 RepID=A0A6S9RPL5_CHRCT
MAEVTPPAPMSPGGRAKLSFPPLVSKWTVRSQPNWPGAQYTRRTKLKTHCDEPYSAEFLAELQATLGDNFHVFEQAMQPATRPKLSRGRPPAESGGGLNASLGNSFSSSLSSSRSPSRGGVRTPKGGRLSQSMDLSSTTRSLSGAMTQSRFLQSSLPWGPLPDVEDTMDSLNEWFGKYGRPKPETDYLGSQAFYSQFKPMQKRCCGEPSQVEIMVRGTVTN